LADLAETAFRNGNTGTARQIIEFLTGREQLNRTVRERMFLLQSKIEQQESPGHVPLLLWKQRASIIRSSRLKNNLYELIVDELVYRKKDFSGAEKLIDSLLRTNLSLKEKGLWREKKADLFLLQKQFDRAAIEYTLIREDFPYEDINYRALYKIGLASFFSGDFDWAHTTLKALKKAADKEIANDALRLDFIIISNKEPRDTIGAGLKAFGQVYFDYFSRNYEKSLQKIDSLKPLYKGQKIYDDLLFWEGKILEKTGRYNEAVSVWEEILSYPTEKIYREEALYRLGIIFEEKRNEPGRAMEFFKRIITEYPQGFHVEQARKHYRKLKNRQVI
jgi:tetratricopeptide (TPR) repeat protein